MATKAASKSKPAAEPKLAPRPDYVMVGHQMYFIEYMDEAEWASAREPDEMSGTTRHQQASIRIRLTSDVAEQTVRETLLHEVLHAAWYVSGAGTFIEHYTPRASDIEEAAIMSTSPLLLSVFQQNPDLLAYLTAVN